MREMLAVTAAIKGIPELSETVALLTDGRFSGAAENGDVLHRRQHLRRTIVDFGSPSDSTLRTLIRTQSSRVKIRPYASAA